MSKDRFHSHFTTDLYNLPKLMEIQPSIHFPSSHGIRTSVARGQLLCFYPARIFPGATPVSELPLGDQLLTNEYENVVPGRGDSMLRKYGFLKIRDPKVTMGFNTKSWSSLVIHDLDDLGPPPIRVM